MGASITLAGESLIAQKQAAQQVLDVQRFIFANVPGLDPSGPVDRAAGKPAADRIVYTAEIPNDNAGFVNPNQVVYSLQVGSDVGDWDFNWIGLETAEGVLFAVAYVPTQQKRRNVPPLQIGNNITRNFLVVYDGAQALTGVTIDASTWQHDFTVRLAGIDERARQSNRDIFGRACFFGSALQVEKVGSAYQVKPGTAYIEGIRVQRGTALAIVPPALPTTAWLDVALQRELSDVVASWSVVFGTGLADRTDSAGVRHYLVPIADLVSAASLLDRRPVEAIDGPLVQHFAARTGDYEQLRARATTKEDVDLGNLPNAKSDDPASNSSEILATTKAVHEAVAPLSTGIAPGVYDLVEVNANGHVTKASRQAVSQVLSADAALTASQRGLVLLDGSAGARTFTLPLADAALGVIDLVVRRVDNTENRLTVKAAGTNRIRFHTHLSATGYPFFILMGAGDWWHLRSDGAGNWWPIGRLDTTPLGRSSFETTTAFQPGGNGPLGGVTYNRGEWPWLWDHAQSSGMLTTEALRVGLEGGWTSGDGLSTFRGPTGTGEFIRIVDDVGRLERPAIQGTTALNSTTVTLVDFRAVRPYVGMPVTGTNLQAGTTLAGFDLVAKTLTLSTPAKAAGQGELTLSGRAPGSSQKGSLMAIDDNGDGVWNPYVPGAAPNVSRTQTVAGLDPYDVEDYGNMRVVGNTPSVGYNLPGTPGNQGSTGVARPHNIAWPGRMKLI
ncbi:phage tail protein [Pseudomonas sp. GZD-209]|uniref:phage tail protein n=1 Tax=Pseudomonas sp. GZD-209 TaxID=3404807 RepID=UPI003BB52112